MQKENNFMLKIKNNLPAIFSCVFLVLILCLKILIDIISGSDLTKQIIIVVIGMILVVSITFLKEKYLYNMAAPLYIFAVGLLIAQMIYSDHNFDSFRRFISINNFSFLTATVLPLCSIQLSKSITKYKTISLDTFLLLCVLTFLPILLVMEQSFYTPVIMAAVICTIILLYIVKKGKLGFSYRILIIAAALICILLVVLYYDILKDLIINRINVIISRGRSNPYDSGWVRTSLDGLFKASKFIGETNYMVGTQTVIQGLTVWFDYKIAIILAKYGWLAFAGVCAVFTGFFVSVFKMCAKIKQSSFAKITALFAGLVLLSQSVYSILGLFLLDKARLNLTFLGGLSMTIVDFILFGIILVLYLKRGKPSLIEEIEWDKDKSLLVRLKKSLLNYHTQPDKNNDDNEDHVDESKS